MNRPLVVALAAIAVVAVSRSASSQLSVEATAAPAFESLSLDGTEGESWTTIDGGLDAEVLFASERGRLSYSLDTGTYATPGSWSFLQQDGGLTWRLGDVSGPHAFVGVFGTARRNGASWAAADYDAAGVKLNFVWSPRTGVTLRAGMRADVRSFGELPQLDQTEGSGFTSALVTLPSRTTLVGEIAIGGKAYAGETILVTSAPVDSGIPGGSGNGRPSGGTAQGTRTVVGISESLGNDNAGRLTWLVRVAQALGQSTGLTAEYSRRSVFGTVPPVVVSTPALLFEDGVYDDPYASDASFARTRLKHIFAGGAEASVEGFRFERRHVTTPAFDETGAPREDGARREDTVWRAAATASLPVLDGRTGAVSLAVELGWKYTRRRSTDSFYSYDAHGVRVGISAAY